MFSAVVTRGHPSAGYRPDPSADGLIRQLADEWAGMTIRGMTEKRGSDKIIIMLTKKEIDQLAVLLKKIDNPRGGLPQPVFDALCGVVPFVACELAIMNKKGELLLAWREDQWWKGWHFPGGLMRHRETFDERIKATALREVGIDVKKHSFLFPINYHDSVRGHVVSLIFLCHAETSTEGKFFKTMPKDIIPEHREMWRGIRKAIRDEV